MKKVAIVAGSVTEEDIRPWLDRILPDLLLSTNLRTSTTWMRQVCSTSFSRTSHYWCSFQPMARKVEQKTCVKELACAPSCR